MLSKDILIRKATKEDYEVLMVLYNEFVGENRYSKHSFDSFHAVITNSSNRIFVANDNGKLVGFATVSFRRVVRYPKIIAELDELFVSGDIRKKGIGKLLMNAVIAESKKKDCYRLFIESGYAQKDAHIFYEKIGFTNYGYHFIKNL